ncbi:TonB family protein [Ruegeria sp. R14_0]|uniref:energy transducer TonB n=1 Tax=Ruegeria sp. R14_0 TaxID=2821100 RepID=UPI001ADB1A6F|nr:TonB family protein [Ruegeria sp. R14_0]MBO9444603.1 TonB family protein [Ruegeria sp. R14_0]
MIPRSRGVALGALAVAASTHVLALQDFSAAEPVQIEGGGAGETAALGEAFRDYVTGSTASAPVTARQQAVTPTSQQVAVRPVEQAQAAPIRAAVAVSQPTAVAQTPKARPPEPAPKPRAQVASQAGNSEKSARKGNASGTEQKGAATARKTASTSASQGNAEASNYSGHVKRKITRARRKTVNIRGAAIVRLRIGDNGALLSLDIARSSGSKRLDQVALAQVRAAAPFQPPPPSARRDYTIKIVGK